MLASIIGVYVISGNQIGATFDLAQLATLEIDNLTENFDEVLQPEIDKEFGDILSQFGLAQSKESIIKESIGAENYEVLKHVKQMTSQKGIQARMAYELKIN
jgi:hypothetical protein